MSLALTLKQVENRHLLAQIELAKAQGLRREADRHLEAHRKHQAEAHRLTEAGAYTESIKTAEAEADRELIRYHQLEHEANEAIDEARREAYRAQEFLAK
ncbi:hypothetical protein ACN08Y_10105 [Rothia sp. P5764]|uniref:hypothetical protein n=1 Tax=Rothia sp. P5764 TaxID=3402654 RepID=UPI003AD33CF1